MCVCVCVCVCAYIMIYLQILHIEKIYLYLKTTIFQSIDIVHHIYLYE